MPLPNRMQRSIRALFDPQLRKRFRQIVLLQMIEDPLSDDPVDQSLKIRRLELAIGDQMQMIEHYHVRKDQKAVLAARFVDSIADDSGESLGPEDREPVLGNSG